MKYQALQNEIATAVRHALMRHWSPTPKSAKKRRGDGFDSAAGAASLGFAQGLSAAAKEAKDRRGDRG